MNRLLNKKLRQKRYIIVDFDKTLFQLILDWEFYFDNIKDQLIHLNNQIYQAYLNDIISWSYMQNAYVAEFGPLALKLFYSNNRSAEKELLKGVEKNQPLIDFLLSLEGYKFIIWSSNVKPTIERILSENNLYHNFNKIVSREDVAMLKPNPEGFNLIKISGVSLSNYLFIGDSQNDEKAAKALNIDFYRINYFG